MLECSPDVWASYVEGKKDGDETFDSISMYFMCDCTCIKSPNGFYQWKCSSRQCLNCKNSKPAPLKCQSSNELVTVDQFETVERTYPKLSKDTNMIEQKNNKNDREKFYRNALQFLVKETCRNTKSISSIQWQVSLAYNIEVPYHSMAIFIILIIQKYVPVIWIWSAICTF